MDKSAVLFVSTAVQGSCVIVQDPRTPYVNVIWFDPVHGFPIHNGIFNYDRFLNIEDARASVAQKDQIKITVEGLWLVGLSIIGKNGVVTLIHEADEDPNLFMGEHPVYKTSRTCAVTFDLIETYYNRGKIKKAEEDFCGFPLATTHYFCNTFDISSPMGSEKNPDMIWNHALRQPFEGLCIPNPCVELIQGTYERVSKDFDLFMLMRRRRIGGAGPKSYGMSHEGNVGNEAEIEVVGGKKQPDGSYTTVSHVFCTSSTPIGRSGETDAISREVPLFYDRIFEHFKIDKNRTSPGVVIVDTNHTEGKSRESRISDILAKSVYLISQVLRVRLIQVDWDCLIHGPGKIVNAVNTMYNELETPVEEIGVTSMVWNDNQGRVDGECQKGVVILSCLSGVDRCNGAAFFYGIKLAHIIANKLGILLPLINNVQNIKSSSPSLVDLIARFFLNVGDIMCRMFFRTPSIQKYEILPFVAQEKGKIAPIPANTIMERRKMVEELAESIDASHALFTCEIEEIPDALYSVKSGLKLVSAYPGIHVISPSVFNPMIFGNRPFACVLGANQPVIIGLHNPTRIVELVFRVFNSTELKIAQASTVSVYGGMYVNRMFPIVCDLALFSNNDCIVKYTRPEPVHYDHELNPNLYENVRYLMFKFDGAGDFITITNIYVFGVSAPVENISPSIAVTMPPVAESASFEEIIEPDTHLQAMMDWEEKRLAAMIPHQEFQSIMIGKRICPMKTIFDSLLMIFPTSSSDLTHCDKCRKSAAFRCGMCLKQFCHKCMKEAEARETRDEQLVVGQVCSNCIMQRTDCAKKFPLYEAMKLRMLKSAYPFIIRNAQVSDMWSVVNWAGTADQIPSRFIYEPPIGVSGENAEIVLDPMNRKIWDPKETFVSLALSFKQTFDITSIVVHCTEPVVIDCEGCKSFVFQPPVTEFKMSILCQQLNMFLRGKISISRISVHGTPSNDVSIIREPQMHTKNTPIQCYMATMRMDKADGKYDLNMDHTVRLCGLNFAALEGVSEIFITCSNSSKGDEMFKFVIPKTRTSGNIMLPVVYECNSVTLRYIPRGRTCNVQVAQIITEGTMQRAKSMLPKKQGALV